MTMHLRRRKVLGGFDSFRLRKETAKNNSQRLPPA